MWQRRNPAEAVPVPAGPAFSLSLHFFSSTRLNDPDMIFSLSKITLLTSFVEKNDTNFVFVGKFHFRMKAEFYGSVHIDNHKRVVALFFHMIINSEITSEWCLYHFKY